MRKVKQTIKIRLLAATDGDCRIETKIVQNVLLVMY